MLWPKIVFGSFALQIRYESVILSKVKIEVSVHSAFYCALPSTAAVNTPSVLISGAARVALNPL